MAPSTDTLIIPTCRHILDSGVLCQAPAVSCRKYCRHHLSSRLRQRKMARSSRRTGGLNLPPLQTAADIRMGMARARIALQAGELDLSTAKTLLWGMEMAATVQRLIDAQEARQGSGPASNLKLLYYIPGTYLDS